MSQTQTIASKATVSVKWSILGALVYRVAPPITFLILARLLSPQAFGVLSTAMIFITFSQMFWDAGLGKALIQTRIPPERAANVVFWINIVLGILIYILFLACAPWAATFFNCPQCGPVLQVLGLQVVILALTSVQQNLFMRELDFRIIFWARLIASITPALVAIPMAVLGFGVWSLVAGTLSGSFLFMLMLWICSPWRPQLSFDKKTARELVRFGIWVVLESFGAWLIIWGDSVLLGHYLGMEELGLYRVGWTVSIVVFGLLVTPVVQVAYPAFARLQHDREALIELFAKATRMIAFVSLPAGVGLLLTGPDIAQVALGNKWVGLGLVMGLIGLLNGVAFTLQTNRELYNAIGRPDLNTKILAVSLAYYIPAYLIAAPFGLEVFTYTRLAVSLLALGIHLFVCSRFLGLKFAYWLQWSWSAIVASGIMAAAVSASRYITAEWLPGLPDWAVLGWLVTIGMASYIVTIMIIDNTLAGGFWRLGKRALGV